MQAFCNTHNDFHMEKTVPALWNLNVMGDEDQYVQLLEYAV